MFICYYFFFDRFTKYINAASSALLPLLSSIKVSLQWEQDKILTERQLYYLLFIAMYVLTLLRIPATCEML